MSISPNVKGDFNYRVIALPLKNEYIQQFFISYLSLDIDIPPLTANGYSYWKPTDFSEQLPSYALLKLVCLGLYLEIINTFLKNNTYIF